MVRALLDSNILMDVFNGVEEARTEVSYYSEISISAITWMEMVVGCIPRNQVGDFQTFVLALGIKVIHTDDVLSYEAAKIRAAGLAESPRRQIKLPDAIIGATANVHGLMVVTRNPRDFGEAKRRTPYNAAIVYGTDGKIANITITDVQPPPG